MSEYDSLGSDIEKLPLSTLQDYRPSIWLKKNLIAIKEIIDRILPYSIENSELEILSNLLYPRATLYAQLCLWMYNKDSSAETPNTLNLRLIKRDDIEQLTSFSDIQHTLLEYSKECGVYSSMVYSWTEKLLKIDIFNVIGRILTVIYGSRRKELVTLQGEQAQAILNLLQTILDLPDLGNSRSPILRVICELAKKSGLLPAQLIITGVTKIGDYPVASGSFGSVYEGKLGETSVALKAIRDSCEPAKHAVVKTFTREALVWRQLHHPNVLEFYGVHLWPKSPAPIICLVSPWMHNGNINEFLKANPSADRLPLIVDIAQGLHHLHTFSPPIIHGDLKGNNILINAEHRACVADFGLCALIRDPNIAFTPNSTTLGAFLYQSPELIASKEQDQLPHDTQVASHTRNKTLESDIYAFGCVCYEVFSGMLRFQGFGLSIMDMIQSILENAPSGKPDLMREELWHIVESCWRVDPVDRPNITSIVKDLAFIVHPKIPITASSSIADDGNSDRPSKLATSSLGSPSTSTLISLPPKLLNGDQTLFISPNDIVIALMGPTGTGKSTFINTALRYVVAGVSDGLASCTSEVYAYGCFHPDGSGRKVILVDTPGLEDTHRTDYEILKTISDWLEHTYERKITLSGILYFHSIAEDRMRGTPLRNLGMFQRLCGNDVLKNVTLVTTFWGESNMSDKEGWKRQKQLSSKFLKDMHKYGSRVEPLHPATYETSWKLIDQLITRERSPMAVQVELVEQGLALHETSAFRFIYNWWTKLLSKFLGKPTASATHALQVQVQPLQRALKETKRTNEKRVWIKAK